MQKLAGKEFSTDCCADQGGTVPDCVEDCDQGQWLWIGIADVGNLKTTYSGQVTFDAIKNEIDNCRPLGVTFNYVDYQAAHAVAIVGYTDGPQGQYIYIADPADAPPDNVNLVDYDTFKSGIYLEQQISWYETDFTTTSGPT